MKITSIIVCAIVLTSSANAERLIEKFFETKSECEEACQALLIDTANTSFSELLNELTGKKDSIEKSVSVSTMVDLLKEKAGQFECVQKVGEKQLGDLYFKVGYLVKYQETAFFFEFVIIRSEKGYQPKMNDFEAHPKTSKMLEKIPDYCWKYTPNKSSEPILKTPVE